LTEMQPAFSHAYQYVRGQKLGIIKAQQGRDEDRSDFGADRLRPGRSPGRVARLLALGAVPAPASLSVERSRASTTPKRSRRRTRTRSFRTRSRAFRSSAPSCRSAKGARMAQCRVPCPTASPCRSHTTRRTTPSSYDAARQLYIHEMEELAKVGKDRERGLQRGWLQARRS
jgi:hypothetical protein